MVAVIALYPLYFLKVFFLVSLILSLFGVCYNNKKIIVLSVIQGVWDTVVFNNGINLMVGIILMTVCLVLLYIFYLKLLPLYGIILGLISQSLCLILKFGGYSLMTSITYNFNCPISAFVCDALTLVIEIGMMSALLFIVKSKRYFLVDMCKLFSDKLEKGNEAGYEEK